MAYRRYFSPRTSLSSTSKGCCDGGNAPDICCGGITSYQRTSLRGDDPVAVSVTSAGSPALKTAAAVAMTYHGYKRTGSLMWALIYGAAGKLVPLIAVPVAAAQGFGQKKEGC